MPLLVDPEDALAAFQSNFTYDELVTFVGEYFSAAGSDLVPSIPLDWSECPPWTYKIQNETWAAFARDLNNIWPDLYRTVNPAVFLEPQRFSLLRRRNGLVLPGGRFRETYYWDSYWIVRGLLVSGMTDTAQGVVSNLLDDITDFGFIPNGGRVYYTNRSQPPMIALMVMDVVRAMALHSFSSAAEYAAGAVPLLETELSFWLLERDSGCSGLSQYRSEVANLCRNQCALLDHSVSCRPLHHALKVSWKI
jgi:alpha,alpha-trehalase